ncbi:MAG: sulfite exporter TauE/SafE family protein [Weeksellaceae bacterium]|nr:sulfite exporter TauE/SafE family protein [Weeksellaceae bacterium]
MKFKKLTLVEILILILIGFSAGFVGGLSGIGGGLIMVPFLITFMGMSQYHAQGTSIGVLVLPVAFLAAVNYSKAGYINWQYVMFLVVAVVLGSYFGSKLAVNLDQRLLKRIFSSLLILAAIKMIYDSYKI